MSLVGQRIENSPEIQKLIEQLVTTVALQNQTLTDVQGAKIEQKSQAEAWLNQAAQYRGRPLVYPYMGTGAGNGPFVELMDGSIKLDLINGIGIHLFGHGHPEVIKAAIEGALCDIVNQGNLEPNREYVKMSQKLVELASRKSRLKYAWLATCGTMANENALKISRQKHSPARKILAFKNAFAGRSTMMAEVTDNPAFKQGLPEYHEVLRLPFYDKSNPRSIENTLSQMKELVAANPNDISCFVFEPMLGEGGYMPAPREFFVPLLELAKQNNIAVWLDEVQTFCRTGELFAFETLDLGSYVDIVTIAKTAQIGATLYTEEYNPKPGLIAGTFSGATVSLATGMKMLDMLVHNGYLGPNGRIMQIHQRFISGLNRLNETTCKGQASQAEGLGLMVAFTPFDGSKEKTDAFLKKLFENGVIAFGCGKGPYRVRFLIPASIQDREIDKALSLIEKTLSEGY